MEYRVLGPLEVVDQGGQHVPLGGAMQQSVLASLLLRAGQSVALDRLIDELWDQPPVTAAKTIQVYVSRLRRELPDGAITRRSSGYSIDLNGGDFDLTKFEKWAADGRAALAVADHQRAATLLGQALALWRGPALGGLTSDFLRREAERLEEQRLVVVEDRIDAELGIGRHAEIVAELTALVGEHPFRERLRAQLMKALHGSGRPSEALVVYRDTRRLLVDELGMEPGQELRELEQAILRQDSELEAPKARRSSTGAEPINVRGPSREIATVAPRELRKTVTVLFCDLVDSTALAESRDPEVVRRLLAEYFARMKEIVESHGGTVEKFIGDAVMAVFGIPIAHEDDALRACRAALEMRDSFEDVGIDGRIGITTGEVVTGPEGRFATGDAVNVAARLQQAAEPGEILLGEPAHELAQESIDVEALTPLKLRGKRQPVAAYRLRAVGEPPARVHRTPFVGRKQELAGIGGAWARVLHERRCELLTVVGEAGVGKSRLVAEAIGRLDTRAVQGRCLPYGNGITYWPVVEVAEQLGVLPDDPTAQEAISSLLNGRSDGGSAEDIAWGFRKMLEKAAPLTVVFDDLQWAEETFLELIEYLTLVGGGVPILIVAMARPELVERRSTWPIAIRLQPLSNARINELIGTRVPVELKERIARAAGGNPLFVSEMLAMATQSAGEVTVPASLRALLAARLDQIDPAERRVLECGAVEGEVFHRGAVQALVGDQVRVTPLLISLARKGLIRTERPQLMGEDAFRFCHLLIRDSAYEALPKSARSKLHQEFAAWLEHPRRNLVEADEIAGYHLEQASKYQSEVGTPRADLAAAARERLTAAEQRTLFRHDFAATVSLSERALALVMPDEIDAALEVDRLEALAGSGRMGAALAAARDAADRASAAGDRIAEFSLRLEERTLGLFMEPDGSEERLETLLEQALPELEVAEDDLGLCLAYFAVGLLAINRGRADALIEAHERSLEHARRLGSPHYEPWALLAHAHFYGSTSVPEFLSWLDGQQARGGRHSELRLCRACALAMLGSFDEARALIADARAELFERGNMTDLAMGVQWPSYVELLAGNPSSAERYLAEAFDFLEQQGERGIRATVAAYRAVASYELGRLEEAERWVATAIDLAALPDLFTQMPAERVRAKVLARRGQTESAERLARESIARVEKTDFLNDQADAYTTLGEVLERADKKDDASVALGHALELYERKGNLVMAERVRTRLAEAESTGAPTGTSAL